MIKIGDVLVLKDGSRLPITNLSSAWIGTTEGTVLLENVEGVEHVTGAPLRFSQQTFHETAGMIYNKVRSSHSKERDRILKEIEASFGIAAGRSMSLPFDPVIRILGGPEPNMTRKGTWESE